MKLLILGATGGIGQFLLRFALERGHEVTAFVRSPQKITLTHERLNIIEGNLLDADQLAQVMARHDAVLSAFGPATLRVTTTRRDFGKAVAEAMRISGVKRVLLVSTSFLYPEMFFLGKILRSSIFKNILPDAAGMEAAVSKDFLDWTIVRPPRLTNGQRTQKYRIVDGRLPDGGFLISRADVADFMLKEVERPSHVHQLVAVAM